MLERQIKLLKCLSKKHCLSVLRALDGTPKTFGLLAETLNLNSHLLTVMLKELVGLQVVIRTQTASKPPRVEYVLSMYGLAILEQLEKLLNLDA
jgi:DNA-binding HxlR family transcriptional regulator